jgi:hypothetical protein
MAHLKASDDDYYYVIIILILLASYPMGTRCSFPGSKAAGA